MLFHVEIVLLMMMAMISRPKKTHLKRQGSLNSKIQQSSIDNNSASVGRINQVISLV